MSRKRLEIQDLHIETTGDSSRTLFHKELGAYYRSIHGADIESKHVFIQGTRILEQQEWKIIELGFGLATNFRNVLKQASLLKKIHYIALDHQPIPSELIVGDDLGASLAFEGLEKVRKTNRRVKIERENIILELLPENILQAQLPQNWANACFHDPFGPKINPEAWTSDCFSVLYEVMTQDGILSTYGAAGHAKRAMVASGFWIASGSGYGKKREITYASKNPKRLSHGTLNRKYQPD